MKKKKLVIRIIMGIVAALMIVGIIYAAVVPIIIGAKDDNYLLEIEQFQTGKLDTAISDKLNTASADDVTSIKILNGTLNAKDIESLASFKNCGLIDLKNTSVENSKISSNAFSSINSKLKSIYLPKNIVSIESLAFSECPELQNVYCQDGLKQIGEQAFEKCPKLEAVYLPPTVERINTEAFMDCPELNRISISPTYFEMPYMIKYIGKSAFANCISINDIVFSDNIQLIEQNAFYDCFALKQITFTGKTAPALSADVFPTDVTVKYYKGSKGYSEWTMYNLVEIKKSEETTVPEASQITIDIPEEPDITDNLLTGPAHEENITENTESEKTENTNVTGKDNNSPKTEEKETEVTDASAETSGTVTDSQAYKIPTTIVICLAGIFIVSKGLTALFTRIDEKKK